MADTSDDLALELEAMFITFLDRLLTTAPDMDGERLTAEALQAQYRELATECAEEHGLLERFSDVLDEEAV